MSWAEAVTITDDVLGGVLAINQKVSQSSVAPVETGNSASRAYSAGDLLFWNGVLYKALTTINTGTTLTVNTNIAATTVDQTYAKGAPVIITADGTTPPTDTSALWVYPA